MSYNTPIQGFSAQNDNDQQELIRRLEETLGFLSKNNKSVPRESSDAHFVQPRSLIDYSKTYIDFTYENPTVYHVIKYFSELLEIAGFRYLPESSNWEELIDSEHKKYFTTRNNTSLCAFHVGSDWTPKLGFGAIDCHVDSLNAKLKPASVKDDVEGYELLGVAPYGGTLNDLWFDRDLGIGGKVVFRDEKGKINSKLVNSTPHPIARIPTLAPHFGSPAVGPFDKEDQAVPVVGFGFGEDSEITEDEKKSPLFGKHSIHLLRYIAQLADINVSQLQQLDLDLFDVQKGSIGGLKNDFLFAPRLDDRLCSFAAVVSLIESTKLEDSNHTNVRSSDNFFNLVTLYDNEEVGSLTRQGAKGGLMETVVKRFANFRNNKNSSSYNSINKHIENQDDLFQMFARSLILSADVNHLFNPNFKQVYMKNHSPKPNVGVTLSLDPNAHMATDLIGTAVVEEIARKNGDKVQYFQIKNNSRSGGTIGPSISSQTGVRTVDLGIAQLSMHSIRATTGSQDIGLGVKFFNGFFHYWMDVYQEYIDI